MTALPQDDSDRKRLVGLAALFVVLIGVLVGLIMWSRQRDLALTPITAPVVTEPIIATSTPTQTPISLLQASSSASLSELLAASSSAGLNLSQVSIQIINSSNDPQASDVLTQQLKDAGFANITEGDTQTTLSGSVRVSVLATVPLELREALSTQMDAWGYQTNFQEVQTQQHQIEITLTIL